MPLKKDRPFVMFDAPFEFKDAPEKGIVSGHAAVFNNIDLAFDIIEEGAFKRTIKSNQNWPILKDHDPRNKIGFNLEAKEDSKGLLIKEQLNLETQMGREVFSLAKQAHEVGGKDALSIGFNVIKGEPDMENPTIRRIKEIKMWEHSHVTFPANLEAYSVAVKDWLDGSKDLGLGDMVENFYRHLVDLGYKIKDIDAALAGKQSAEGDSLAQLQHSIDRALSVFK